MTPCMPAVMPAPMLTVTLHLDRSAPLGSGQLGAGLASGETAPVVYETELSDLAATLEGRRRLRHPSSLQFTAQHAQLHEGLRLLPAA